MRLKAVLALFLKVASSTKMFRSQLHFSISCRASTVFPRIIAAAIISFFAPKGGDYSWEGDYSREATISNISHRRSCLKEARKGFFGCYSVCETMKDTKEGYFIVQANYRYLCNSILG